MSFTVLVQTIMLSFNLGHTRHKAGEIKLKFYRQGNCQVKLGIIGMVFKALGKNKVIHREKIE